MDGKKIDWKKGKKDGRCNCSCGDQCPLGKTGMAPRCFIWEIITWAATKGGTALKN